LPTYTKPKTTIKQQAFDYFRMGWSIDDVKHKLNRARSTVAGYLAEFIAEEKPAKIGSWVSDADYRLVTTAAATLGERKLSPIFERLDGKVPYDTIRLVMAHLEAQAE
ncbi:MAG TPA: helix-turn-helix domain-containing protein, partial [Pirellulales bacterium]